MYADAHHADDVQRFDEALAGFRALVALLDGAELDGERRAGDVLRVRALLGIARALYESAGDLDGAMDTLAQAEAHAAAEGLDAELLAVQGTRGLLLLRSGDAPAALAALDAIAPSADAPPTRDLAVTLLNRGVLHLEYGDPAAAGEDLRAAARTASAADEPNLEAMARHNLGILRFVQGDLPAALREIDEAAGLGDTPQPVALLDRARVLTDAGLVTDALAALDQASALLDGGSLLVRAEVELARASCLMDLRRSSEAVDAADAAREAFERAGNSPWALRARVVGVEAQLVADQWTQTRADRDVLRARAESAARLAARGEPGGVVGRMVVTYPALLAAAEWSTLAGDLDPARAHLAGVPAELGTAPLPLRLSRAAVVARLAYASGERHAAVRAIRLGQQLLAEHRGLGTLEAVAASGVHALRLNLVDLQATYASGDPGLFFDAVERGRTAAAGVARVVPPDDPELASLLEQARAEHQAAVGLGPTATPEGLAAKRQHLVQARRYQEAARERSWHVEGELRRPRPTTARALRAALRRLEAETGTAPGVVTYVTMAGTVTAVHVTADGATVHTLAPAPEVGELGRRVRADLSVVANTLIPAPLRTAATASLERTLGRLDALLLAPLSADGDLHVTARGRLLTLPWPALPSRRGRRTWVADRVDLAAGAGTPSSDRAGKVAVLAGPGTTGGAAEADAVAAVWPGARVLRDDEATAAAAVRALGGAAVVHLAAHGGHSPDNALFSSLRLADGPLFAYELDGVDLTGAVVVLSACELGLTTSDLGGEALGFASVLLRHGARAVVAAVAPLRDDVAVRVMPRLHSGLRDGLHPAQALAEAVGGEPDPVPLVCFGPL